jgi:hypothetical protein
MGLGGLVRYFASGGDVSDDSQSHTNPVADAYATAGANLELALDPATVNDLKIKYNKGELDEAGYNRALVKAGFAETNKIRAEKSKHRPAAFDYIQRGREMGLGVMPDLGNLAARVGASLDTLHAGFSGGGLVGPISYFNKGGPISNLFEHFNQGGPVFPGFDLGGMVNNISANMAVPDMAPRYADGGDIGGSTTQTPPVMRTPINLILQDGSTYKMHTDDDRVAESLKRTAIAQRSRAGGAMPDWYRD